MSSGRKKNRPEESTENERQPQELETQETCEDSRIRRMRGRVVRSVVIVLLLGVATALFLGIRKKIGQVMGGGMQVLAMSSSSQPSDRVQTQSAERLSSLEIIELGIERAVEQGLVTVERVEVPDAVKTVYYIPQFHRDAGSFQLREVAVDSQVRIYQIVHTLAEAFKSSGVRKKVFNEGSPFGEQFSGRVPLSFCSQNQQEWLDDPDALEHFLCNPEEHDQGSDDLHWPDVFDNSNVNLVGLESPNGMNFVNAYRERAALMAAIEAGYRYNSEDGKVYFNNGHLSVTFKEAQKIIHNFMLVNGGEAQGHLRDSSNLEGLPDGAIIVHGQGHTNDLRRLAREKKINLVILKPTIENMPSLVDTDDFYQAQVNQGYADLSVIQEVFEK